MHHDVVVVGGGVSGLATAYWLLRERPDLDVVVLEAGDAVGGKVRSTKEDGFTLDWGPSALVPGAPDTAALIEALGISAELVSASESATRRYVVRQGALLPLPDSAASLVGTRLLSAQGKLRALLEPIVGRAVASADMNGVDESVSEFIGRRFGREAARAIAELLVVGLVAGDPDRLSAKSLFPRLVALERAHGSVLRGLIATRRAANEASSLGKTDVPRRSFSFIGGVGRLTEALGGALGQRVRLSSPVTSLVRHTHGYELQSDGSTQRLIASEVVLATPAHVTSQLLADIAPSAAEACRSIDYAGVTVVSLGYLSASLDREPAGFGFLAARGEGVRSLGVQFSSSVFPDHAPAGTVLLRAIAGGRLDESFMTLTEAEAVSAVRRDLEATLGIRSEPIFVDYRTVPAAIPQYEQGHAARLQQLAHGLAPFEGLHVVGNAFGGVGVNDSVHAALSLARSVARGSHERTN